MRNVASEPAYAAIRRDLTLQLHRLQAELGDRPHASDA